MEKTEQLFKHTKPNSQGQRKTFAGVIKNGKLQIGMSQCSASDQFNKNVGRNIALGRAVNSPISYVEVEHVERFRDTFHISCELLENIKK